MAPKKNEEVKKSSFQDFLYNPADGTVMGRDFNSWSKILLFYAVYYSALFVLFYAFTISYYGGKQPVVEENSGPTIKTRTDQPGAHVYPFQETIRESARPFQVTLANKEGKGVTSLDQYADFLNKYFEGKRALNKDGEDCTTSAVKNNKQVTCKVMEPPSAEVVKASVEAKHPFIAIELNKVIKWAPKNIKNIPAGAKAIKDAVYIDCYEYNSKKGEAVAEKDKQANLKFWNKKGVKFDTKHGVLLPKFFPFTGNKAGGTMAETSGKGESVYNKPYAVAQMTPRGEKGWGKDYVDFRCEIYADNIDRPSKVLKANVNGDGKAAETDLVKLNVGVVDFGFKFE